MPTGNADDDDDDEKNRAEEEMKIIAAKRIIIRALFVARTENGCPSFSHSNNTKLRDEQLSRGQKEK